MLHCLNTSGNVAGSNFSDMTVLERQRARLKWQQEQELQQGQGYFSVVQNSQGSMMVADSAGYSSLAEVVVAHTIKPDPAGFENGWKNLEDRFDDLGLIGSFGLPPSGGAHAPVPAPPAPASFDVNSSISRTCSCPPSLEEPKGTNLQGKINSLIGKDNSFKKRKVDHMTHNKTKADEENDNKDKRIKVGSDDGESKITGRTRPKKNNTTTTTNNNNNKEVCADTSKEKSKASEAQKPDYIHVRARRGQATDSHSLAERVRREKISERMKYLQDLVPGCNKITGKAGMLDEIINYVQSLQRQVEFLSMKLAAVNPRLDFNIDDLFAKESQMFPACAASFPLMGMSSDIMTNNPTNLQFNPPQQMVSGCGIDTGINTNPSDMGLRRTISAPVPMPETFLDSSCFTQILPSSTWESDFQNLYTVAFDQARTAASFPSHLFKV